MDTNSPLLFHAIVCIPSLLCFVAAINFPGDDELSSVADLLAHRTTLSVEARASCVKFLKEDGVTNLQLLVDAEYNKEDLLGLGIRRPHVKSILEAIKTILPNAEQAPSPTPILIGREKHDHSLQDVRLLTVLRRISSNEVLQDNSPLLRAIGLTGNDSALDICQVLLNILDESNKNPNIVRGVLEALGRITEKNGDPSQKINRQRLGEAGACKIIVEILCDWYHNTQIIKSALFVLTCLAFEEGNTRALATHGACERVVAVLTCFPKDPNIHSIAFCALRELTYTNMENRERLGACGACERVTAGMASFPFDVGIQTAALQALINLATTEENSTKLGFHDACERIIHVLVRSPLDCNIQKFGIGALANLASEKGCRKKLGSLGGYREVLAGMKAFPLDRDVQLWGMHAFKTLAADKSAWPRVLVATDVCEVVLGALGKFSTDHHLQYQGCWAVRNILLVAIDRGALETWIRAGVREKMEIAMAAFPLDGELRAYAAEAILCILKTENEGDSAWGRDESGFTGVGFNILTLLRITSSRILNIISHVGAPVLLLGRHNHKFWSRVITAISRPLGVSNPPLLAWGIPLIITAILFYIVRLPGVSIFLITLLVLTIPYIALYYHKVTTN